MHKGELCLLKNRMYSQSFFDTQISHQNKLNPAAWLQELTMHYLGAGPIIQSTHHFLRILKQDPNISIQDSQTAVILSFQKCNFPVDAADRLQRDIFVVRLNDTFKRHRRDVISRETFATFTFAQVITNTRDFENGLKTESSAEILTVLAILCMLLNWKSYLLLRQQHPPHASSTTPKQLLPPEVKPSNFNFNFNFNFIHSLSIYNYTIASTRL